MSSYLAVVCNQLKATIPKAIVHCLVVQAKTALLDGFLQEVAGMEDESLKGLLAEERSHALEHLYVWTWQPREAQ